MSRALLSSAIILWFFMGILAAQMVIALAVSSIALFLTGKVFHIPGMGVGDFFRELWRELQELKMATRKRL